MIPQRDCDVGSDWERVASVTPGGKPYFYYRKDLQGKSWWIAWDRYKLQWRLSTDGNPFGYTNLLHGTIQQCLEHYEKEVCDVQAAYISANRSYQCPCGVTDPDHICSAQE